MQDSQQQRKSSPTYRYLDLVMAYFVAVLIISNVASSAKIVDLGFSLFGVPMAFDGGTLLFPLSYIFGDILTEVYGFRTSRRVIWTGFFCLALASFIFFVLKRLPSDATWEGYAGTAAYDAILGGMSTGGIALASLSGYWAGEFSNSAVLSRMKVLMKGKHLWMRTIGSTLVGELVDTTVFVLVASFFNVFGWDLFITLVLTNYLFKCAVEILMTPVTYKIVAFLKKKEQVDTYDIGITLNPFSFGQKYTV
ncbi:MAG: queuosine precursor transporter [Treponemataceae bacterium]|nr:queuosine precursor transporter [Treponemataceae bacterium]